MYCMHVMYGTCVTMHVLHMCMYVCQIVFLLLVGVLQCVAALHLHVCVQCVYM